MNPAKYWGSPRWTTGYYLVLLGSDPSISLWLIVRSLGGYEVYRARPNASFDILPKQ